MPAKLLTHTVSNVIKLRTQCFFILWSSLHCRHKSDHMLWMHEILLLIHLLLLRITFSYGTRNTVYSSVVAKRKSGIAKHKSMSSIILCVHVCHQHQVWTSNWRSQLWQDCQIQISSFCGVNSVFDFIKGRQIFFCVSMTKSTHFLVFRWLF